MTSQVVNGVVDRTWTKTKSTRYGDKNIHYCEVNNVPFSTGFKKVFHDGEMINCVVEFKYGELQYQEGATPTAGTPAAATPVAKGNFKGGGYGNKGKFPIDPKDGQMSIIRQSSMDRAVTIVRDMVSAGTVHAPKTKEEYIKLCIEIALNITDYASGNDIMQMQAAAQVQKEAING